MKKVILSVLLILTSSFAAQTPTFVQKKALIQRIAVRSSHFNSKLAKPVRRALGRVIVQKALERQIKPSLVASIIAVESRFRLDAYNRSGDYSLAQINYSIWSKEFKRLEMESLSKQKLITDVNYAIEIMVKILEILKKRHSAIDEEWYLRYHSGTPFYKKRYKKRLDKALKVFDKN